MSGTQIVKLSLDSRGQFKTLPYESSRSGKPPIPVTIAPPRIEPPRNHHPAFRDSAYTSATEEKRDSGLAPTLSSTITRDSAPTPSDEHNYNRATSYISSKTDLRLPSSPVSNNRTDHGGQLSRTSSFGKSNNLNPPRIDRQQGPGIPDSVPGLNESSIVAGYSPITTPIPSDDLGMDFLEKATFSKRGSMLLTGQDPILTNTPEAAQKSIKKSSSMLLSTRPRSTERDLELQSLKVRSMYETGSALRWENGSPTIMENVQMGCGSGDIDTICSNEHGADTASTNTESLRTSEDRNSKDISRNIYELAGGLEDWRDIQSQDVDRYGFITARRGSTRDGTPEPKVPNRTSTVLQTASNSPRKKRGFGRAVSSAASTRAPAASTRSLSRKISTRSLNTQMTTASHRSASASFRTARNRLPGFRDRRWMEEAGDMLTLPPGLADIAEHKERGRSTLVTNAKEAERSEKWRKMAKVVRNEGGMIFEFDTKNSKLIERTWKGIPDRWRAPAWYSFLSTSAKRVKNSPSEREIIEAFHELLDQTCLDDVQIDLDVPRTINSHIMFRRRYRGGQRLLFRVLHCLSLYLPNTGYVQGMASIAATLLCYFDEERTFVMLVRMWTLRSMDKLYAKGFEGLTAALDEFRKKWMGNSIVSKHLDALDIDVTAYGIRWYLTLFNYSIPFAAQLRVWDAFMLLGDADPIAKVTTPPFTTQFGNSLDVLHAASSALIDGTREILLDSDFENSMKVLTSWVPIKDEELFMKVAKAEWKLKAKKR